MAMIGSLGVGSGLDLNGLMDKLTAAENLPLTAITKQQAGYNAKLSAYGTLQSLLGTFQTAAKKLADPVFFSALKATSSAADVLSASADSTAVAGTYAVSVTQLAQAQSLVSSGVASTTSAIGSGAATTVTIDFGTIAGTFNAGTGKYNAGATFTADAARPAVSLSIGSTNNTLAGIRDEINKTPGIGVAASIVNDGTTNRLVLTSTSTGQKSSMRIAVTGDATVGSLLANDPTATQNMQQTVTATDAALTVNGIAVTSATNTVVSSVQGVTMTLGKTGTSTVTVQKDTASVEASINDFVKAYNSLKGKLTELTKYDITKKSGAALVGDSTVRFIQNRIRAVLDKEQAGGAADPKTLSDIGVAFQMDGTLAVNSTKLSAALSSNSAGVANLFANSTAATGVGKEISALVDGFNASDGLLKVATDGANTTLRRLTRDHDDLQGRIDEKLARYRAQFQQLDALVSGMNSTSNYLAQQFSRK